jgi:hypothetical protein
MIAFMYMPTLRILELFGFEEMGPREIDHG